MVRDVFFFDPGFRSDLPLSHSRIPSETATLADEPATREESRQLAKDIRLGLIYQNDAANNFVAEWEGKTVWMNTIDFSLDDATADEEDIHFSIAAYYELNPGELRNQPVRVASIFAWRCP